VSDHRDILQAVLSEGADALAEIIPGGVIPAVLARLAPLVERAIAEAAGGSIPTADRVIVRDHRGTRLAAEAPDPGARDEAQLRALATPR